MYDDYDFIPEEDYTEPDWEEDWDDLEMGFNPYEGCYDWDC